MSLGGFGSGWTFIPVAFQALFGGDGGWNAEESTLAAESVAGTDHADASTVQLGPAYQPTEFVSPPAVHRWPLDGHYRDVAGGVDGTAVGSPGTTVGVGGMQATTFDGVGDRIGLGDVYSGGSFSWSVWVRLAASVGDYRSILSTATAAAEPHQAIDTHRQSTGLNTRFSLSDGTTEFKGELSRPITDETWHHLALVYDAAGAQATMYLDGTANVTTPTTGAGTFDNPNPLSVMGAPDNNNWNTGDASDVRVFDRALTESEVQTLTERGGGRVYPKGAHYYPLETDATDQWGTNDGTVTGATFPTDAERGAVANFDGTNDYIRFPHTPTQNINPTEGTTIALWYRRDSHDGNWRALMRKPGPSNHAWALYHRNTDGTLYFLVKDGSGVELSTGGGAATPAGEWHHYVGVYRPGPPATIEWHIDGALAESREAGDAYGTPVTSTGAVDLGYDATKGRYDDGAVDDLKMYDRALDSEEIATLYDAYQPGPHQQTSFAVPPVPDHHFPFDGDATDEQGTADGTWVGTESYTSGMVGQAADFDGTTDRVDFPLAQNFFGGKTALSFAFWFSTDVLPVDADGSAADYLWSCHTDQIQRQVVLASNLSELYTRWETTSGVVTRGIPYSKIGTEEWHHYCLTYDGSAFRVYLDGVEEVTEALTGATSHNDTGNWLGADPAPARHFDGAIDDVRVYDRALDAAEVQRLFQFGTGGADLRYEGVVR